MEDHGEAMGHDDHHEEASDEGHAHDDGHHAEEPATTYAGLGFVELFYLLRLPWKLPLCHISGFRPSRFRKRRRPIFERK